MAIIERTRAKEATLAATTNALVENEKNGLYVKQNAAYRDWITADGASGFPAEAGRYHLYSAVACPWAHRTVLFRVLKKLEPIVGLTDTFREPGGEGFGCDDVSAAAAAADPGVEVVGGVEAEGRVLSYTAVPAEPRSVFLVELGDGRRALVADPDPALVERAQREDLCGRAVRVAPTRVDLQ